MDATITTPNLGVTYTTNRVVLPSKSMRSHSTALIGMVLQRREQLPIIGREEQQKPFKSQPGWNLNSGLEWNSIDIASIAHASLSSI